MNQVISLGPLFKRWWDRRATPKSQRAVVNSKSLPKMLGRSHAHDEALKLLALLLADDVAVQNRELHRAFFFGRRKCLPCIITKVKMEQ